jgi:hypothetical protein
VEWASLVWVVVMETGELSSFELLRDQCIVVQLGSLNATPPAKIFLHQARGVLNLHKKESQPHARSNNHINIVDILVGYVYMVVGPGVGLRFFFV